MSNTVNKTELRIKHIKTEIRGLAQQLSKLAPNPKTGLARASLISLNSAFRPAAEYEGMMGSMILDGFLGEAFSGAASNDNGILGAACSIDYNMLEAADQYLEREDKTHNNFGRGRGSIALYDQKPVSDAFKAANAPAQNAYQQDLNERADIEQHIAGLLKELDGCYYDIKTAPLELCA
jgi:hypothetical protein